MFVYKLLHADEWASFDHSGGFAGSAADLRDGFIHMSTGAQVAGTFIKYFSGVEVMLVTLDADRLGVDLRWEASRGGGLFPHLYRPLVRADVVAVRPFQPGAPV